MADLKLKSIQIRNWMKFRNVHLKFPERGLVVVTGHNLASNGALQSVGSGKTGFGEAICHTLLGVSSHFDHVGDYSLDTNGDTYICLEADFLGKPLKVEMGYKCKELKSSGEALQVHVRRRRTQVPWPGGADPRGLAEAAGHSSTAGPLDHFCRR